MVCYVLLLSSGSWLGANGNAYEVEYTDEADEQDLGLHVSGVSGPSFLAAGPGGGAQDDDLLLDEVGDDRAHERLRRYAATPVDAQHHREDSHSPSAGFAQLNKKVKVQWSLGLGDGDKPVRGVNFGGRFAYEKFILDDAAGNYQGADKDKLRLYAKCDTPLQTDTADMFESWKQSDPVFANMAAGTTGNGNRCGADLASLGFALTFGQTRLGGTLRHKIPPGQGEPWDDDDAQPYLDPKHFLPWGTIQKLWQNFYMPAIEAIRSAPLLDPKIPLVIMDSMDKLKNWWTQDPGWLQQNHKYSNWHDYNVMFSTHLYKSGGNTQDLNQVKELWQDEFSDYLAIQKSLMAKGFKLFVTQFDHSWGHAHQAFQEAMQRLTSTNGGKGSMVWNYDGVGWWGAMKSQSGREEEIDWNKAWRQGHLAALGKGSINNGADAWASITDEGSSSSWPSTATFTTATLGLGDGDKPVRGVNFGGRFAYEKFILDDAAGNYQGADKDKLRLYAKCDTPLQTDTADMFESWKQSDPVFANMAADETWRDTTA
eukprot:g8884.t1